MKTFALKLVIFICLFATTLTGFFILSSREKWRIPIAKLTKSEEYAEGNVGAREIIPYIQKVQEENTYTKLIIGDSVCNQIFNQFQEYNDEYCICGTNRAITLAGQYILAKEFIDNHEKVTDIYLIIIMDSLVTDFDRQFGYQYVVMPFTETDTINQLEDTDLKTLKKRYGVLLCWKPIINIIETSPLNRKLVLNYLSYKDQIFPVKSQTVISDVSYRYLKKIYDLCKEKKIQLHLIPGPHADTEDRHNQEKQIREELTENGYIHYFESYFESMEYYPIELFRDGVHFDEEIVEEKFFESIIFELNLKNFCTE